MAVMPKPITHPVVYGAGFALTDAATIAVDASLGNYFTVTLGGNRTLGNPSNAIEGMYIVIDVIQDGTGSRTLAYGSAYKFGTSYGSPTLTTTAGATDRLEFQYKDGSVNKWRCTNIALGF